MAATTTASELRRANSFDAIRQAAGSLRMTTLLDTPVSAWLAETRVVSRVRDTLHQVVAASGCLDIRQVLVSNPFQNQLMRRIGAAGVRLVVEDLADWLAHEFEQSQVVRFVAGGTDIGPGMDMASLRAWAAKHHVLADLGVSASAVQNSVSARSRSWFWTSGRTLGDAICAPRAPRGAAGVPADVQEAAVEWLRERAVAVAEILAQEKVRIAAWHPPAEPLLRPLWDALLAARGPVREGVLPPPFELASTLRMETVADPPTLTCRDGYSGLCPRGGAVRVALQAPEGTPVVTCGCGSPARCALTLATIDGLLSRLSSPQRADRQLILDLVGVPAWERALADFDRAGTPVAELDDAILGWRVDLDAPSLTALACRPKKRGDGFKVAKMTTEQLEGAASRCVLAADRDVRDLVLGERPDGYRAQRSVMPALMRLVGHPRVFPTGSNEPVPVRRATVEMAWSADATGGIHIAVELGGQRQDPRVLNAICDRYTRIGWCARMVAGAILVFPVDAELVRLLQVLGARGERFPAEAAEGLLARLPHLSKALPTRLAPELRGQARPADETPVVRLDAPEGALLVQVIVRPLGQGAGYAPGDGPPELHAVLPDGRAHVLRDLPGEALRARTTLAPVPLPPDGEAPPFSWTISDVERGMEVVTALRELGGAVRVEWTDPSRKRTTVSADASRLRIKVQNARDWFGLSGQVEVDGASVSLDAVLEAVLAGRRFVPVDGATWIRLTDRFLEQLAGVAEVVQKGRQGLELPRLAAPLVDALADEGAALATPTGWGELLARVRAADGYEPELPAGLTVELRDYQRAGFRWLARLAEWSPGACLADDMGLGKTVQALALLLHRAARGPALIVAPMSVGFNWIREAARFAPSLRVRPYRGDGRKALLDGLAPGDVLVTSYDLLPRDAEALAAVPFATLVLDEAQAIKNATTARAKAAAGLQAEFRLALTGTPVENRIAELWSLFRVVVPGLLGSWDQFRARFGVAIEREGDQRRRGALGRLLRPFLLRRVKSEVARELPSRTEVRLEVVLSREERQLYDQARVAVVAGLSAESGPPEQQRFRVLAALTRLRQLACHPRLLDPTSVLPSAKLARLRELVAELRSEGHRALVFSQFTRHLALVREALEADGVSLRYLDGGTSEAQRRAEVDAFQRGEGEVFLISLKAGGTGLNLTAATYVIHLDPWWNPAVEDQASDRAHRIGQTQPVTVYRLVARGTIEEGILALHAEKRDLVSGLLDGSGAGAALGTDELIALLQGADDEEPAADETPTEPEPAAPPAAPPAALEPAAIHQPTPVDTSDVSPAAPAKPSDPTPLGTLAAPDLPFDLDEAIETFEEALSGEADSGRIRSATMRSYLRLVDRFAGWARARHPPMARIGDLDVAIVTYLVGITGGTIDAPASDAIVGKTALRRFLAHAEG